MVYRLNNNIYIYILCTSLAVIGQHPYPLLRALSTGVELYQYFLNITNSHVQHVY